MLRTCSFSFFFFNDTATTEIYTLSLHDALPIFQYAAGVKFADPGSTIDSNFQKVILDNTPSDPMELTIAPDGDRKSTRLNSSHSQISYAVFCLKKKKNIHPRMLQTRVGLSRVRS